MITLRQPHRKSFVSSAYSRLYFAMSLIVYLLWSFTSSYVRSSIWFYRFRSGRNGCLYCVTFLSLSTRQFFYISRTRLCQRCTTFASMRSAHKIMDHWDVNGVSATKPPTLTSRNSFSDQTTSRIFRKCWRRGLLSSKHFACCDRICLKICAMQGRFEEFAVNLWTNKSNSSCSISSATLISTKTLSNAESYFIAALNTAARQFRSLALPMSMTNPCSGKSSILWEKRRNGG